MSGNLHHVTGESSSNSVVNREQLLFVIFRLEKRRDGMPSHVPSPSAPADNASLAPVESRPLPLHPQLSIISTPLTTALNGPIHVEYRVYNHKRLRSGRVVRGDGRGLLDLVFMSGLMWSLWYGTLGGWFSFLTALDIGGVTVCPDSQGGSGGHR